MRAHRHRTSILFPVLLVVATTGLALAQPRRATPAAELEARLTRLEAQVAELAASAAEVGAVQAAVAAVTERAAVLRQELDTLGREQAGAPIARERMDALEERVASLAREVTELRAVLAAAESPEGRAVGGAAGINDEGGFVLASSDGRFQLALSGYAQLRWLGRAQEAFDEARESSFLLRRARLAWDGHAFAPWLTYRVQLRLEQSAQLWDYYFQARHPSGLWLRGGQFKVPFTRSFLVQGSALIFAERSVATDEFRYGRDIGLLAGWLAPCRRFEASLGLFNGAGQNVAGNDNELEPLAVARVSGAPLGELFRPEEGDLGRSEAPALVLEAAATFENAPVPPLYGYAAQGAAVPIVDDEDADGERYNVRVLQAELSAALRWRGLGIEAEGYLRREWWGTIGERNRFVPDVLFRGGYLQATYLVLPAVVVGARGSFSEVSPLLIGVKRPPGDAGYELPFADLRSELSLVGSWAIFGRGLELTGTYSFLDWRAADVDGSLLEGVGEQRLILEAQAAF